MTTICANSTAMSPLGRVLAHTLPGLPSGLGEGEVRAQIFAEEKQGA